MVYNQFEFIKTGKANYSGFPQKVVDFIRREQVKDKSLWRKFTEVFGTGADVNDKGWRGEYFGKMMRGACLIYIYTGDKELYNILFSAVKDIIGRQEPSGRISTYDVKSEFSGWDMWSRKYVMVGLEYFYDICNDENFKREILNSLIKHADYIILHVGKNKKSIRDTSEIYGGLNSCSILDAFLQLYRLTGYKRYLQFGEYVIDECDDYITAVTDGKLRVCEFPETKAYELMSFFEGILTYYECTGKEFYLDTVLKFFEKLQEEEQTIIGSMGTRYEFFDDSIIKQTEYSDKPMLETCVTVTWIRVLTRLLLLTGDVKYADRIETSVYNALYGTINFDLISQFSNEKQDYVQGLPFDSYSPLVANRRGNGVGGMKEFSDGTHYGCCACIGAAGVALFPLTAVLSDGDGVVVNYYLNGKTQVDMPNGKKVSVEISGDYPRGDKITVRFKPETDEKYSIKLRMPDWAGGTVCLVGENKYEVESGYLGFDDVFGDAEIRLSLPICFKTETLNGRTAFKCGPIVLARDEEKEGKKIDFDKTEIIQRTENGEVAFRNLTPRGDEFFRFELETETGNSIILSDYATCGKKWTGGLPNIGVWLKIE